MENRPAAVAGCYIAHHRWLDAECGPDRLFKVGHSGDLRRRLADDAYTTNFPPGWRYVAVFEVATKEEAFLLETAVLHCCRHRRLGTRELVRVDAPELVALVAAAAAALGLTHTRRDDPTYPASAPARGGAAAPRLRPVAWATKRSAVDHLTISPALASPALASPALASPTLASPALASPTLASPTLASPALASPESDLASLLGEMLSWEWPVPTGGSPLGATKAPEPTSPSAAPSPRGASAPASAGEDALADELDDAALVGALADGLGRGSPYDLQVRQAVDLRDYQREAAELCARELRQSGRAILQMACRCGKTPVAFSVMREYLAGAVLFLVPGLPLLRQTAQKLAAYGCEAPTLLVGSDPRPVPTAAGALAMTTDPAAVRAFLAGPGPRLVISTYQSSAQVPVGAFALTVFDEAHRVCGGSAPRPFNHAVAAPRAGARLFMTATPAYDPPAKSAITMKDRALFGGVAYRYHLRRGIAAGHVNDFRLEVVAAPAPAAAKGAAAEEAAAPGQLLAAMAAGTGVDKLLVFCRDIAHAGRLCAALGRAPRPPDVAAFACLVAHSRMGAGGAAAALHQFAAGGRAVLFTVRMLQEGVEIPALNAVFFAAPRHSPRDIIQSLCRPLNRAEGKPPSVVFLPVLHDPARPPADPANLSRYASVVPFVDALLDEDPRLYEHLLDPAAAPYPLGVLGTHSLGLAGAGAQAALLGAVRRAVRYGGGGRSGERLLRVEAIPWDRALAEIERVVRSCGRFPKTTDSWTVGEARVCLHRYYRWAADEYAAARAGQPSKLEPHQIFALQSLPLWEPYGVEGPYPWRLCMEFLERWLRENGGVPPMLNVHNGGYVGLDATMMERLSGAMTCINQGDGRARKGRPPGSGFTVSVEKQADLDRICALYGLRWRKERDADGALVRGGPKTFIQESYARFQAYYKAHGADGEYIKRWYEGFPQKHLRQENMEVQEKGLAPPRWRTGRRRKQEGSDAENDR